MSACLNLVVALPCEAKPLVKFYHLKKQHQAQAFAVYRDAEQVINLIVTGVGRVAAAAAVAYLHTFLRLDRTSSYLNVGVAGSAEIAYGEAVLAEKIIAEEVFYPSIALLKPCLTSSLVCVDTPNFSHAQGMMDMESTGFFKIARMFVHHDQVHVMKVISDNNAEQMRAIRAKQVEALIETSITSIDVLVQQMRNIQASLVTLVIDDQRFYDRWHFTVSERIMLQEYLRRWHVLNPSEDPFLACSQFSGSSHVLQRLRNS